ncbi:MAG: SUMF1/EgtB/PvdO family nonheme iron enzyme [Methyloprofundus sp.]|nr:SUMF1/EgtB/PvdO family nonheme iron enzyme [Methyloprofundus sp.]
MIDQGQALAAKTQLEEFQIEKVLGEGGFGITYLAYDQHLDKHVAIKEYLPSDFAVRNSDATVIARTEKSKEDYEWGLNAFLDEARMLAKFKHPNIVTINRFFHANGTAYIVMDYAGERTLADVLKEVNKLNEEEVLFILKHLIDGLKEVHQQQIYHRDIKPANIILQDDGNPVLIDFGAARQIIETRSRSITTLLTPGYAPIEQYSNKGKIGAWTDIYALAAIAYHCLTGNKPEDASERVEEDQMVPAMVAAKGQGCLAFLRAVDQGLSVFSKDRPVSLEQWWALLIKGQEPVKKKPKDHFKTVTLASSTQQEELIASPVTEQSHAAGQQDELAAYLPITEFSQKKGIAEKRLIKMIQAGGYAGKFIEGQWYVSGDELNKNPTVAKSNVKKYSVLGLLAAAAVWGGMQYQENQIQRAMEMEALGDIREDVIFEDLETVQPALGDIHEDVIFEDIETMQPLPNLTQNREIIAEEGLEETTSTEIEQSGVSIDSSTQNLVRRISANMMEIPDDCFEMGSPIDEVGRDESDERQHIMCVDEHQMSTKEVTVGDFKAFVAATGYRTQAEDNVEKAGCYSYKEREWGWHQGVYWGNMEFEQTDEHPVVCVSWYDAQAFIAWLNESSLAEYRLPTEVEWEYAARAESQTLFFWSGSVDASACRYANINDSSWSGEFSCSDNYKYTAPVASYKPNDFGLYDMSGNVWEWTCTQYESKYQGGEAECMSPAAVQDNNFLVVRGGSYSSVTRWVRMAVRSGDHPWERDSDRGFRLVRVN